MDHGNPTPPDDGARVPPDESFGGETPEPLPEPPEPRFPTPASSAGPPLTSGLDPYGGPASLGEAAPYGAPAPYESAPATPGFDPARWLRTTRSLGIWLVLLASFGIGGVVFEQSELAVLAAVSGLYVASQAADLDRQWSVLHYALTWVVPAGGVLLFTALAVMLHQDPPGPPWDTPVLVMCVIGVLASIAVAFRPVADRASRALFRHDAPTHTRRVAARMVVITLLFALPGWFFTRNILESKADELGSLLNSTTLATSLVGYILLALAATGFMLKRDLRATLARLGIGPVGVTGIAVAALGVIALYALNGVADKVQEHWFHDLWVQDQGVNEAIGGGLGGIATLVLGLSAGIGEEITMRGALQPRLGVVLTSLVFASLHVQYSWYGMVVIFLLGMLLGTVRQRTNTTVAMLVHAAYDMAAVLSVAGKK